MALKIFEIIKNPGKSYVEWLYGEVDKIVKYYKEKDPFYRSPRIKIKSFHIVPYYDDVKREIVIPVYTLLDLEFLFIPYLLPFWRLYYLLSLPATFAHELSHSTRESRHSLAGKEGVKYMFLLLFRLFTDRELLKEERIASKETREVLKAISPKIYRYTPFYAINFATILGFGKKLEEV